MDEKTFFEHGDVKVTSARFISGGQTFAMSNVTSVKTLKEWPNPALGIAVLLGGLAIAFSTPAFGLVIAAAAGFYLYKLKSIYHVMITTAGQENSALTTHQPEYLRKIVSALNNAIVHRG